MRYAFIAAHTEQYGVERMCQVLGVARSGYYTWKKRGPSARAQANQELDARIRLEFTASRNTYGSPRIQAALSRKNVHCGRHRVAFLMRRAGLRARPRRKRHPITTQRAPGVVPAPNRLNQAFWATIPDQKWVCDFTYIGTAEGWLYLAVVIDLYSRRVIGWAMSNTMDTALVEAALRMALLTRQPPAGLLHHSDQGCQYTATTYLDSLQSIQAELSMSRVGNCYDNAVVESFFSTLKTECVIGVFTSRAEARKVIFEYLEVWYNRQRLHSSLGYCSPVDFEQRLSL
jgi:transposase InsO family protein